MSHQSPARSAFSSNQQVVSNLQENNDSLLDESNSFDLKNQIYQLTSKYNNLEYEKNKMLMSYENVLKEHKQKYAILERLCSEKQEKEDKLNYMLTELRSKCAYLAEENDALKKELHSLFEKNRITPDFNTIELAQEMNMLGDLLDKEQRVQKLDRQLQDAKEGEYNDLREKVAVLEKENKRLKEENLKMQAQKSENIKTVTRDVEEYHKGIIKFKDNTIRKLEEQQNALSLQLEQARQTALQRNSQKSDEYAQNRRKDEKISELQDKLSLAQKQRMRVQSENNDLQEDNKRLQGERKILQKSKKSFQEQIFQLTNEISQVRAAAFNDKIDCKKQVNSIKLQMQDEKNKLRSFVEEKAQQNKRLREGILTLNDQNQELRDKQMAQSKEIQRIMEQNYRLSQENQKYLREGNKWEDFGRQSAAKADNRESEERISLLQRQLASYKNRARQSQVTIYKLNSELQRSTSQLNIKQQLVQIMKIQKTQFDSKIKQSAKKFKQCEQSKNEKEKVIFNLESEIRTLKDDNKQLQLANDELNERLQTMQTINSDIVNYKHQLQLQKQYYEQMRREHEDLRKKHKKSQQFKAQQNSKQTRYQPAQGQSQHSMRANSVEQSREKELEVSKVMEQLRAQNYDLQVRINEAENEINKKGIDINMKQQEILKLKEALSNPRELNFQPIIQTSKKTQFNAVFLQNKILLLEKEILGIKNMKEKEFEQYKKVFRKKMQEKYLGQLNKCNLYISELQKNVGLLSNKLQRQEQTSKQLNGKLEELTRINYEVKYDYSQTLEQLNTLLQKYKQLQTKHKQLQFERSQIKKIVEQNNRIRGYVQKVSRNTEQKSLRLSNANDQIQKLNQTLMIKQSQIKLLKLTSPNSSFIGSQRGQQKSGLLNIPAKQQMEIHPSSDTDSLRSWIKKSPNFSRV